MGAVSPGLADTWSGWMYDTHDLSKSTHETL